MKLYALAIVSSLLTSTCTIDTPPNTSGSSSSDDTNGTGDSSSGTDGSSNSSGSVTSGASSSASSGTKGSVGCDINCLEYTFSPCNVPHEGICLETRDLHTHLQFCTYTQCALECSTWHEITGYSCADFQPGTFYDPPNDECRTCLNAKCASSWIACAAQ